MRRIARVRPVLWPENYTVVLIALSFDNATSTYPIRTSRASLDARARRRRVRMPRSAARRRGARVVARLR